MPLKAIAESQFFRLWNNPEPPLPGSFHNRVARTVCVQQLRVWAAGLLHRQRERIAALAEVRLPYWPGLEDMGDFESAELLYSRAVFILGFGLPPIEAWCKNGNSLGALFYVAPESLPRLESRNP